jgi:dephospho-CoA kinase
LGREIISSLSELERVVVRRVPRIGLTGGIGSGKTTISERFLALGAPVIDADQATRALCMPGEPALAEIVAAFGHEVLDMEGKLDRAGLRERIFIDENARRSLEAILHPRVREEMDRQIKTIDAPYAIFSIPLLLESGQLNSVDRVLVVDCPEELRIRRVMARDNLPRAQIEMVLATQATQSARLAVADDILMNDVDLNTLYRQVDTLHQFYLEWGTKYFGEID